METILAYTIASILAIILGQAVKHLCNKMPPLVKDEIKYREFLPSLKNDFKIDLKYSLIQIVLFNLLVYFSGLTLTTVAYFIVISTLLIVFSIDYRFTLIPDEAHIALISAGIIKLIGNPNNLVNDIFGALAGGAIFYILGLLALLLFKKEGMGFGDVKLMAALGFVFGLKDILVIALLSFFIGAVVGVTLMLLKKTSLDSYIPFGPFIVISAIAIMYISPDTIISIYINFCVALGRVITDLVYNLFLK